MMRIRPDEWHGLHDDYELSRLVCAKAQTFPVPPWQRDMGPRHSFMTVIVRRGFAVIGRTEADWLYAWHFSNHLTNALQRRPGRGDRVRVGRLHDRLGWSPPTAGRRRGLRRGMGGPTEIAWTCTAATSWDVGGPATTLPKRSSAARRLAAVGPQCAVRRSRWCGSRTCDGQVTSRSRSGAVPASTRCVRGRPAIVPDGGGGVCGSTRPASDGRSPYRVARTQRRARGPEDVISVLARAVREVEAAVERRRVTPAVRTKFQVVALLVREEHARVRGRADQQPGPPGRAAEAPGRDRDDPREDRRARPRAARAPRRGCRRLRRGQVAQAGHAADGGYRAGPRGDRAGRARGRSASTERRVVPQSVVSRQLANPFLAPDFSVGPAEHGRVRAAWPVGSCSTRCSARSNVPTAEPRRAWPCRRRRRCACRATRS